MHLAELMLPGERARKQAQLLRGDLLGWVSFKLEGDSVHATGNYLLLRTAAASEKNALSWFQSLLVVSLAADGLTRTED
jgi:hypothetical protein